jgi:hypothetical protein
MMGVTVEAAKMFCLRNKLPFLGEVTAMSPFLPVNGQECPETTAIKENNYAFCDYGSLPSGIRVEKECMAGGSGVKKVKSLYGVSFETPYR